MKKTISVFLYLMIVTSMIFSGCSAFQNEVVVEDDSTVSDPTEVKIDLSDVEDEAVDPAAEEEELLETEVEEEKVEVVEEETPLLDPPSLGIDLSASNEEEETVEEVAEEAPIERSPVVEEEGEEEPMPALIDVADEEEEEEPAATTAYVDGSYSASGSYQSPAGSESITVTLQIENDKVASVSVSAGSANATSKNYQNKFASGINGLVVGKNIAELGSFSQVNGSSLTPSAFNQALNSVRSQALS